MKNAIFPDATATLRRAVERTAMGDALLDIADGVPSREVLIERCRGYAGVLNNESIFDASVLAACPALKAISFLGTGASSYIDLEECERRGVTVCTVAGYGDRTVAEHALALILAVYRDVAAQNSAMRNGGWGADPIGELGGKTIGIIGLGGIGQMLAGFAAGLGLRVVGWNRSPVASPYPLLPLEELLATADIVSLHLALTPETQGFLSAERLAVMKRGAVLVNTARGALIDEDALVGLLTSGHLAGAGVDVYRQEPPGPAGLRDAPNLTMTCHSGWQSPEAIGRLADAAVANLAKALAAGTNAL